METVRFKTKVSKSGTIHLPKNSSLINKEVDVIIIPTTKPQEKTLKAGEFVKKWAGFLLPLESNDPKYDYLTEKYK